MNKRIRKKKLKKFLKNIENYTEAILSLKEAERLGLPTNGSGCLKMSPLQGRGFTLMINGYVVGIIEKVDISAKDINYMEIPIMGNFEVKERGGKP